MFLSLPSSCTDVLAVDKTAASGIYFLWLLGTDQATRMWCDMEADGGGWTMVYSYMGEQSTCSNRMNNKKANAMYVALTKQDISITEG